MYEERYCRLPLVCLANGLTLVSISSETVIGGSEAQRCTRSEHVLVLAFLIHTQLRLKIEEKKNEAGVFEGSSRRQRQPRIAS